MAKAYKVISGVGGINKDDLAKGINILQSLLANEKSTVDALFAEVEAIKLLVKGVSDGTIAAEEFAKKKHKVYELDRRFQAYKKLAENLDVQAKLMMKRYAKVLR